MWQVWLGVVQKIYTEIMVGSVLRKLLRPVDRAVDAIPQGTRMRPMLARVHGRALASESRRMKTMFSNTHVEKVRLAYKSSPRYRALHGEVIVRESVEAAPDRVPGQDDEEKLALNIGRDPLEVEFMEGKK